MAEGDPQLSRARLEDIVEGHSDAEVNQLLADIGTGKVLDQVFEAMSASLPADRAGGEPAVVQWDISAPDAIHTYQLKVGQETASASRGTPDQPRVTIALALADLLRLAAGKLDGMQAFMAGKLKLSGDMMFAQSLQGWFPPQIP